MNVDSEDLVFTSYYSSVSAASSSTTNLYRPYENINTRNSEEWSHHTNLNHNPILATTNVANVAANVLGGYGYLPETGYPNYSHYLNVNWWNQFYYQQATYDAHVIQDARLADSAFDESNVSSYELEIGSSVSTSEPPSARCVQPPLAPAQPYPTESIPYPFASYQQYSQPANAYTLPHQQFPIRPVPQQPTNGFTIHQCKACLRVCSSVGGLKRHAKFCRASQANLAEIFDSIQRKEMLEANQPSINTGLSAHLTMLTDENTHPVNSSPAQSSPSNLHSPPLVIALSNPSSSTPERTSDDYPHSASALDTVSSHAHFSGSSSGSPTLSPLPRSAPGGHEESPVMNDSPQQVDPHNNSDNRVLRVTITANNRDHRKKHCPHCEEIFSSERALVDHLATHNVEKPYGCLTCGGRFSRRFHLTRHVKQRGCGGIPRAQLPCEFCGKVFTRKDNLREHVKVHTGQARARPKLPCPIPFCGKEFASRTQLQDHVNYHTDQQPYACTHESCTKKFRSNAALRKHTRSHNCNTPHKCHLCNARFAALGNFAKHMATHSISQSGGSLICERCQINFSHEDDLRQHVNQNHQKDEETYGCTLCRRTYRRRWRLQQHYRLEHCEKRQKPGDSLLTNRTTEIESTIIRTFLCEICQRGFASRQSLRVHSLTHPAELPVNCPECHKGFERRELLLRHLRSKHRMPTILAVQAIQAIQSMNAHQEKVSTGLTQEGTLAGQTTSSDTILAYSLPFQASKDNEDATGLEANIIELLSLLVDSSALKNFGWPGNSVDFVLRAILVNCGKEPVVKENEPLVQRLRSNIKQLFSFIVDDQGALETLFERRPIEQVLEQVIQLAKSSDNNNNIVQLAI